MIISIIKFKLTAGIFLRIITGIAKNKPLKSLEGESVRPTTSRVKEAIFSAIQFDILGRRVLDLFAGTGQLGLEAMSRGAYSCDFVDESRMAAEIIRQNIKGTGLVDNTRVITSSTEDYIRRCDKTYDLVFIDPPYNMNVIENILHLLRDVLSEDAIVVCEHTSEISLKDNLSDIKLYKVYRYGITSVSIYKKGDV